MRSKKALATLIPAICVAFLATAPSLVEAGIDEKLSFDSDTLLVRHLIGAVAVEGHGGGAFEVEVQEQGRDSGVLDLDVARGSRSRLDIRFPEGEQNYVYPALGRGSSTTISARDGDSGGLGGLLSSLFGRNGRLRVRGSGSGMEVWADVTIRVPRGATLEVKHGVGSITARNTEGRLSLDISSGPIEAGDHRGRLDIDTGSGHIQAENISGSVNLDTGSGRVALRRVNGDDVDVDTGSGRVELEDIDARSLNVDTGSGRVEASGLMAEDADIDTGSGSVTVRFDRIGDGSFSFDTGSGGIELQLPAGASARISASTGSGGIRVDAPGADMLRKSSDEAELVLGGGAARFDLDTGSGGIRISTR